MIRDIRTTASATAAIAFTLALAISLVACADDLNSIGLQRQVDEFRHLNRSQDLPERFLQSSNFSVTIALRDSGCFDANRYFDVLTHLSMEPGYTLDYFYMNMGGDGRPLLYARRLLDSSFTPTGWDWFDTTSDGDRELVFALRDDVFNHVMADDTPRGFFELAVLHSMGGQFYLAWHCNYNDNRVICDETGLRDLFRELNQSDMWAQPSASLEATAYQLDLLPRVSMADSLCTVSLLTFSKWGGFSRTEFVFRRCFPHVVDTVTVTSELRYDCGISF